mmetsp:Transcript_2201/g.6417  ORF Transcript_2201/g.6417 Transcript_2201/m.6417 type:complete len:220 (-) Transcript_2201:339-998(-)
MRPQMSPVAFVSRPRGFAAVRDGIQNVLLSPCFVACNFQIPVAHIKTLRCIPLQPTPAAVFSDMCHRRRPSSSRADGSIVSKGERKARGKTVQYRQQSLATRWHPSLFDQPNEQQAPQHARINMPASTRSGRATAARPTRSKQTAPAARRRRRRPPPPPRPATGRPPRRRPPQRRPPPPSHLAIHMSRRWPPSPRRRGVSTHRRRPRSRHFSLLCLLLR